MAIVIEILGRANRVLERHRFSSGLVSIGRSYQSDVILGDAYVDPHHLNIELLDDGLFALHDKGSVNGVKVEGSARVDQCEYVANGTMVTLGRTKIKIVDPNHPVAAAENLSYLDLQVLHLTKPIILVSLIALLFLKEIWLLVSHYDASSIKGLYVEELTFQGGVLLTYVVFWSLWGRFSRHDSRHLFHTVVICVLLILYWFLGAIGSLFTYNFNWPVDQLFITALIQGSLILIGCYLGLHFSSRLSDKNALLSSLFLAVAIALIGLVLNRDNNDFTPLPKHQSMILSPHFQFSSSIAIEDFIEKSEDLLKD